MALIFRRQKLIRHCLQPSSLLRISQRSVLKLVDDSFRTSESNPVNHTLKDVGKFYTIPNEVALEKIFKFGGWPPKFYIQCKTFSESCLMIRKPGLEIIHYMENTDYNKPINKYVLFPIWLSKRKDVTMSQSQEGLVDLNARAAEWLSHFKLQNSEILTENELPVENDYTWNIRESAKKGDSLLSLVDYGILRGSFSSEVVLAVLKEIKLLSKSGKIKTLLMIDGFNAFFENETKLRDPHNNIVTPRKISFLKGFYDMVAADWHNGAVVLSIDALPVQGQDARVLPLQQMKLEGFEYIFPFVPIEVGPFTDAEFSNMLKYYKDRKWLREEGGDLELKYLSCQNGYELMRISASL